MRAAAYPDLGFGLLGVSLTFGLTVPTMAHAAPLAIGLALTPIHLRR